MTTLMLVRHAAHDWIGRGVAGRMPGVGLNDQGSRQAKELIARLEHRRPQVIYCSPMQRAQETAAPLARALGMTVVTDDELAEIDFGEWTGRSFEELDRDDHERWRLWCERKSEAGAPGGELFADVQRRIMTRLEHLRRLHPSETVLVCSHGDVIKAALAGYLGLPLDHVERFEIAPASASIVETGTDWYQVKLVNGTGVI
jgi:broad specificity phosphatase PhoE